ncbi:MAG: PqqD family protein [Blastocatellia bacterium]
MKREREQGVPEARKEGLVVQHLSDEVLVYDQRRHKGHCLNQTAALVWKHCDGKTSVSEMASLLEKELKTPVKEEVIWLALEQLGKTHLLSNRVTLAQPGITRREVMRRIGLAAAVALPVVTSITAPTAAQAATCKTSGQACTTSAECCSAVCSANKCA